MSSLAGTTEKMRSILKIGGIVTGILFGIYLLVMGGFFVKNIFFPSAPELPEQAFGKLPEIKFERKASPAIDYRINTVTGDLPTTLPTVMFVYKLQAPKPDLLALQNARNLTSRAGFKDNEVKLSDSIYQWTNSTTNAFIKFDINSKSFEINSDVASIQNLLGSAVIPDEDRMKQYAGDFLSSLGVDTEKLVYREGSIKYLNLVNGVLVEMDNAFNAKIVRLSLFNENIAGENGDFQFVYGNPDYPLVTLLVVFPSSARMAVIGGEAYNKIISDEFSDYPLKTPSQALEELKQGKAYLYNPQELSTIEITDIYMAYYLDKNITEYAQPVYVFEGPSSKAYVDAVQFATASAGTNSE